MSLFKLADNVKETTTTTGTGTISLLGAFAASFKTFVNGIGNGVITTYKVDDGAGAWECRFGLITSGSPDTITNAGFISSSTGSAISFGSGTKTVTCVPMPEIVLTPAVCAALAETTIASATTTDLGSIQTILAQTTGTTTITSFGTSPNTIRIVRFAGVLTLTHNAASLILPGAANITTQAGDVAIFISDATGNWRCMSYQRADGTAIAGGFTSGTFTVTDTSGASLTFTGNNFLYRKAATHYHFWGELTYPSTASGLSAQLSGFPFTSKSNTFAVAAWYVPVLGTNVALGTYYLALTQNSTNAVFRDAGGVQPNNSVFSTDRFYLQGQIPL
jgi:hypothetical protein